ncbi:MAG: SCP2 sterol-binding domain-containing protein [Acidimicrobiia bacterium]
MDQKFEFLSPEWEQAAEELHDSNKPETSNDIEFSMNVTITPTPFGEKLISIDVKNGQAAVEKEHIENADITVKTDYETAYKLFTQGDMNIVMSKMLEGKVVIGGNVAKLLSMATNPGAMGSMPFLEKLANELKSITK